MPDGPILPRFGDIDGVSFFADIPAQRQHCPGAVEARIATCLANTEFASDADNRRNSECLPVFEKQARARVAHVSFEWRSGDANGAEQAATGASDQAASVLRVATESAPRSDYSVVPADRVMEAARAANVRTGPGPDYEVVKWVVAGERVQVTGEVSGRNWMRVALGDGGTAFIYAPLLKAVKAVPTPASPVPFGPSWSVTENQACQVWNHGNRDYEPFIWSGACVDGKASGEGRLTYRGGAGAYEGDMRAGTMHGRGVLIWVDGFRYEGEFSEGRQHGFGTLFRANGDRYEGAWRHGRPHGHGTFTTADGETYEGAWRDGCLGERDGRWASLGTTAAECGFE